MRHAQRAAFSALVALVALLAGCTASSATGSSPAPSSSRPTPAPRLSDGTLPVNPPPPPATVRVAPSAPVNGSLGVRHTFTPSGLTIAQSGSGSVIGEDCDDKSLCVFAARRTSDGGRTWTPASLAGDSMAFTGSGPGILTAATGRDLWAGAPGLFASHDGGVSWVGLPVAGDVVALSATRTNVWVITQRCVVNDRCGPFALQQVNVGGGDPRPPRSTPPAETHQIVQLLRPGGDAAYIVDIAGRISSTVDGVHWHTMNTPVPVGTEGAGHGTLAADSVSSLWFSYHPDCPAACGGGDRGRGELYRSTDSGNHWHRVGKIPAEAGLSVVAFSSTVAWLKDPAGELERTSDGGRTWQQTRSASKNWEPTFIVARDAQRAIAVQYRVLQTAMGVEQDQSATEYAVAVTQDGGRTWAIRGAMRMRGR